MDLSAGTVVADQYQLESVLGSGGMGVVWKARDLTLNRLVALKVLRADVDADPAMSSRFQREARILASLDHPAIVPIFAWLTITDDSGRKRPCIVMQLTTSTPLSLWIRKSGPRPLGEAVMFLKSLLGALAVAHEAGVIHRDVKPQNILVDRVDGQHRARLVDFGIAKTSVADSATTQRGMVLGTPAYMSPEQIMDSSRVDARADLWALSVCFFELLTGEIPFTGATIMEILAGILAGPPPSARAHVASLPGAVDEFFARAFARAPVDRPSTAAELLALLPDLAPSEPTTLCSAAPARQPSDVDLPSAPHRVLGEPSASFVGRDTELARLVAILQRMAASAGSVAFAVGTAGAGKSTLVEVFVRQAQLALPGLLIARGACVEQYGSGEAYLPFLDALEHLLAGPRRARVIEVLRAHAPTWCLHLPACADSAESMAALRRETLGATKDRMMRELGDAFAALAAVAPVLLVLEDLQWADASSVDLARHLAQRAPAQRILVVGTLRPDELDVVNRPLLLAKMELEARQLCHEITLAPLDLVALRRHLDLRFPANDFAASLATVIERRTGGHPLFVEALVRMLVDRGEFTGVRSSVVDPLSPTPPAMSGVRDAEAREVVRWRLARPISELDLDAPEDVKSLIRRKLQSLDEESRRTLQYASVESDEFLSVILARSLGVDEIELEERLDRLARAHRLIVCCGEEALPDHTITTRYRFVQALYAAVLYEDLVPKRRAQLHHQVAERLTHHHGAEAPRIAARLAIHWEKGRDLARAVESYSLAGRNAIARCAPAEAADHLEAALRLVERLPPTGTEERRFALLAELGEVHLNLTRFDAAIRDFEWMAAIARTPAQESAALNGLSRALFFAQRIDGLAERVPQALAAADRSGDAALRAGARTIAALNHLCLGELDRAVLLLDEAIALAGHQAARVALGFRGLIHYYQSEYESACQVLEEVERLAEAAGDGHTILLARFGQGLSQGNLGRMSDALETLEGALVLAERNASPYWMTRLPSCLGWLYRELGAEDRARACDQRSLEVARRFGAADLEPSSLINPGRDLLDGGDAEDAMTVLGNVSSLLAREEWMRWRVTLRSEARLARRRLTQGDTLAAAQHASSLRELAIRYKARKYLALSLEVLAEVALANGDPDAAEGALGAALEVLDRYPTPIVAHRLYATGARVCAALNDPVGAQRAHDRGRAIVDALAVSLRDEGLREGFLRSVGAGVVDESAA
jgi:tetratricopeptide (TPR) repeat protein